MAGMTAGKELEMEVKFYRCKVCGNMVGLLKNGGGELCCCGQAMELLIPGASDGAAEKHTPAVTAEGTKVCVQVGSVLHPTLPEHHIEWVYLLTEQGGQRKAFKPGEEPKVTFLLSEGNKPISCYTYCNLHGLWMTAI